MALKKELEKLTQEELDGRVIDLKCYEASLINNQGREAQIEYVITSERRPDAEKEEGEAG